MRADVDAWAQLELLGEMGWRVAVMAAFAGGSLVIAFGHGTRICHSAPELRAAVDAVVRDAREVADRRTRTIS